MNYQERKYRLTGISPILGSIPLDKGVYEEYIVPKTKTDAELKKAMNDVDSVQPPEESSDVKVTGFYRDNNGNIILKEYQIKGFLKEAGRVLKDQLKLLAPVSKVDNFVFIMETDLPLVTSRGSTIQKADSIFDRPLRAMTAQGPRVALAYSEQVCDWSVEFTMRVLDNPASPKSAALTFDVIESLFDYGSLKGLLQWRNGGYGKFTFERIG